MSPLTPLRRALIATLAASTLVIAAGCGGNDDPEGNPDGTLDEAVYLTSFGASAHDAFIFLAQERGYFEEAGIDLTIELGAGNTNYPPMLAGQAHFSYTDLTGLLTHMANGELEEGSFQALAAIHHTTLVAIVAPADLEISSPADLTGLRIGAFAGSPTHFLVPAYAEVSGWEFDPGLLEATAPQELFGLLASGQVDVLSTFIIQQGVIESIIGRETIALPFNEYLDDVMGTGLISTTALAEENPDLVERFRDAALRGLRDTLENPEEAIATLKAEYPDAVESEDAFVAQIRIMDPYITGRGDDEVGLIDEAHVIRCISVLLAAGVIPQELPASAILGDLTLVTSSS